MNTPLVPGTSGDQRVYIFCSGGHTYIGICIYLEKDNSHTFAEVYEFQKVIAPSVSGHTVATIMSFPHFNALTNKPLRSISVYRLDWIYEPTKDLLTKIRDYIVKEFGRPAPAKKQKKAGKKPKMKANKKTPKKPKKAKKAKKKKKTKKKRR